MVTYSLSTKSMFRSRSLLQRVNWSLVALLITPYLIATIWFVFPTKFWLLAAQPFAELVITHRSLIRLGTAITAVLSALFCFWPRNGGRLAGWWSGFVGLAFATFFVQYSLRFIDQQLPSALGPTALYIIHQGFEAIIYLCSAFNNLLFLAAARILLIKNKKPREIPPPTHGGTLARMKHSAVTGFEELRSALPTWTWVVALLALLAPLDGRPYLVWARFPDAIFSAYCLAWFGYATASNFNVRSRPFMATIALLVALVYGAGQVVFAINPIIAYTAPPNKSQTFPLPWVREKLGNPVNSLTINIKDHLKTQFGGRISTDDINPKDVLDGAVYAVLLPMKGALFIPAFFLYLLFINSVNDFRQALGDAISTRKDYLSADGIVTGIGESLEADTVTLFIRIPGVQKRPGGEEERVLPLAWDANDSTVSNLQEDPFPIDDDELLVEIMKTKGEEILGPSVGEGESNAPSQWLVPVKFHGGVIGVLKTTLKGYLKNYTTLQKLRLMAEIVAPSVQDFRSLAAADQIGFRFTRLQVDHPKDDLNKATERMVNVLHDVLAPLATRMDIEIGFEQVPHTYPEDGDDRKLLEEPRSTRINNEEVSVQKSKMLIWTGVGPEDGYQPVGTLSLAMWADKDRFSRPTLAAYHLTRKMAASFATDGLFDVARNSLGAIIKDLGVEFSKEGLTLEEWFAAILHASTKAGLLWAVATNGINEEVQGASQAVEVVPKFSDTEIEDLLNSPLSSLGQKSPVVPAVRLRLTKSKQQLWFGLARPNFRPELDFESPWKVFLYELKNVADTALDSLQQRQLAEAEKNKTAQYQGVMTIAVTTGTLMHQLLNMIKGQLSATEVLEEELRDGLVQLKPRSADLLRSMRTSAEKMQALTETFKNVTKMEERRPCSLKDVVDQAVKLFEVSLVQRLIKVRNDVFPDAEVDVPFYIAAFAVANLVGNAIDAVRSNGWIEIGAEDNGTFFLCHVTNNGPRISDPVKDTLFQFGQTNKPGHNGWGLYFVGRSLQESGGGIWLSYSNAEETRFTIRLPKPKPT